MTATIHGMGHPLKRKEDARFIRGKGTYVDDIKLPNMLHVKLIRSPYAHAKIKRIDVERALKVPGVVAVITGKDLQAAGLSMMPTLMNDRQPVLALDKVYYPYQEVAAVVAEDRYIAEDAAELVEVEYEPLEPVMTPQRALEPDAPLVRPDKGTNKIFTWSAGDKDLTDRYFQEADVIVKENFYYHRIHVAHMETCGCVAHYDPPTGKLTLWMTTQAPHAVRTVASLFTKIPEHKIRIIAPDIGGGFGGKVYVYPGYVVAAFASIMTERPVKWIETRTENLSSTAFARDAYITAEVAAKKDGTLLALRMSVLSDHGAFFGDATPSKFPFGLFTIVSGCYKWKAGYVEVTGVHTNKPPGGIAYRCSFRVTEAAYVIERMIDILAHKLGMDPAELRLKNFIKKEEFPYTSVFGWEYDSGDYERALRLAMEKIDYEQLRKEQEEKRKRGELMGIGISTFVEIVGAGPSKIFDILGIKMFESCEVRIHPTGKVIARFGTKSQGQGHETTFAQILAEKLGIPEEDITVEEGDTDTAPYGLGTYASRSTPTAGAAAAVTADKIIAKAKKIAAHLLEVREEDIVFEKGRFYVKEAPEKSVTIQDVAFAAYTNPPPGLEPGLEAVTYYDPPNMTFPFGAYICVVDIDRGTGEVKVRRFVAVDDCGNVINPMIVEGQIHGALTMGFGTAFLEEIRYDEQGNIYGNTFMDYLIPTAVETPRWETYRTVTPSPHHPLGAKGVAESPTVGSPAAFENAVVDALSHLGVTKIGMPLYPWRVYSILKEKGVVSEL
ncbi:MAG: aerobic carbon-monoxide dehydrogenase large subunit [Nitrososphaerota archaeon]|nr:aerobic carbon-monoxide dehydrogenase large subunit [Candidatus Calditenuis fumarioli]